MVAPAHNDTFSFTQKILDGIPPAPAGTRTTYKDNQVKGLILRVTDKGQKSFVVYKKVQGRPLKVTLGQYPTMKIGEARGQAGETLSAFQKGKNPNVEKKKIRQEITLGELFEDYMERHSKAFKKSWAYDEREIPKHLGHWFNRRISSISPHEVQELHFQHKEKHGLYQANRTLERVRGMYNKAIAWGWEGTNPASRIRKFKEKSRDRFIDNYEMASFFEALALESNGTARDYILLSLMTGARRTNVLSMRWDQINFEMAEWRIPETKNGEVQRIPLVSEALEILQTRKRDSSSDWVFPSEGSKVGYFQDPKKAWQRLIRRATVIMWHGNPKFAELIQEASKDLSSSALPESQYPLILAAAERQKITLPQGLLDVRIHDLRRTMGSFMTINNASSFIVGKALGHKSPQSTAVYARLNQDPVRSAMQTAVTSMFKFANNSKPT